MEAAGALGAAAPILESIPNPSGGAGWSWVGCGCHKVPIYRPNSNSAEFRAWEVLGKNSKIWKSCNKILPRNPKMYKIKIKILFLVTLWPLFGLHDLHWPFSFFLKSLRLKKSSGMVESHF